MSEVPDELLDELRGVWRDNPTAAFRLADEGRHSYPDDPRLLCAWGDLNQLSDECLYDLEDSLKAYRYAAEIDASNGEAFESMGYFLDVLRDDPAAAEPFFRKAIELDAGRDSVIGLARVLAEMNRPSEAIQVVDDSPYAADPKSEKLREEIVQGVWSRDDRAITVDDNSADRG